jgi:hypothetical protein
MLLPVKLFYLLLEAIDVGTDPYARSHLLYVGLLAGLYSWAVGGLVDPVDFTAGLLIGLLDEVSGVDPLTHITHSQCPEFRSSTVSLMSCMGLSPLVLDVVHGSLSSIVRSYHSYHITRPILGRNIETGVARGVFAFMLLLMICQVHMIALTSTLTLP